MSATASGDRVLAHGGLSVEIALAPLRIHVRRAGRRLLRALTVWACEGEVRDRFVQVTEGVIAD
jgi:alpha-D-xyloside xylohydrolase